MIKNFLLVLGIMLLGSSCVKNVDFDQADDLRLTPVVDVSLLFFEETPDRFLINGVELTNGFISDTTDIQVLDDSFIVESLIRAELEFEFTNSVDRAFRAEVVFLDTDTTPIHSFDIDIPATQTEITVTHTENFTEGNIDTITATTQMVVNFFLLPGGQPITEETQGSLKLRSKGTFYLLVE
ncbi:hypothetical protein GWK08_16960 [Leptobacterium flavescens]|uniref:DUF4249 family protein n=1 Tax=Leptobacterium flavescens TaxID=472055 RepID=A0A6P0UT34_9FLAO|nr:hypothetical protein [Leptobacterium flavescens]NER15148.1 hypothetical protein [Leptobacterium flavescens]